MLLLLSQPFATAYNRFDAQHYEYRTLQSTGCTSGGEEIWRQKCRRFI